MTDTELEALLKATEGHTVGKWLVKAFYFEERLQYLDVCTEDGRLVAEVARAPEQEHDARLIAAAPTLRAEVVRLRSWLEKARAEVRRVIKELDEAHDERDAARAEVDRLRAELDEARADAARLAEALRGLLSRTWASPGWEERARGALAAHEKGKR